MYSKKKKLWGNYKYLMYLVNIHKNLYTITKCTEPILGRVDSNDGSRNPFSFGGRVDRGVNEPTAFGRI